MNEEYAGQMEFGITPDGKVHIFQFRAFRKKEEASWNL
jgi:hypothetical protein